ncbi:MAG TPA: hypothetical protein VM925_03755 [Labilithrix sp.]|jgi:hypothetical protein|nr:hypothetical protein [Labilithrix sp.]
MKTFVAFVAFLPVLVSIAACSSSDDDSSPTGSAKQEAELYAQVCEAELGPKKACTGEQGVTDEDIKRCSEKRESCIARAFRPEAARGYAACMKARTCTTGEMGNCSCSKSDDECFREAGLALPANPVQDAYRSACLGKLAECGKGTNSFSDDWCTMGDSAYELYTDALYEALRPCFALACGNGTISTCIKAKWTEAVGECK